MISKIIRRFADKKRESRLKYLKFHYERHLYNAIRFKETMHGLYTVVDPEVVNRHEAIIGGVYHCSREQLIRANGERHSDWGPFPEELTGAFFVVKDDCFIRFVPEMKE